MSTLPVIVNVTATARFSKRLDLQRLGHRLAPLRVDYVPRHFIGAHVRVNRVTISLFPNGKAATVGARSPLEAKKALVTVARRLRLRVTQFKVVNMAATWFLARKSDSVNEVHRIEIPRAYVKVSCHGNVFCMGVKSSADLKRVYNLIY